MWQFEVTSTFKIRFLDWAISHWKPGILLAEIIIVTPINDDDDGVMMMMMMIMLSNYSLAKPFHQPH